MEIILRISKEIGRKKWGLNITIIDSNIWFIRFIIGLRKEKNINNGIIQIF